jgi:hypothetical protein
MYMYTGGQPQFTGLDKIPKNSHLTEDMDPPSSARGDAGLFEMLLRTFQQFRDFCKVELGKSLFVCLLVGWLVQLIWLVGYSYFERIRENHATCWVEDWVEMVGAAGQLQYAC